MTEHNFTLDQLRSMAAATLDIHYSCDAPDTLTVDLKPEAYASIDISPGDRLTIRHEGRVIFSGIIPAGLSYSASAGANETVTLTAQSDLYLLEQTAYTRLASDGQALYPAIAQNAQIAGLEAFAHGIFNHAANWSDSKIKTSLQCDIADRIPVPMGNGSTPCAQLLRDALKWTPSAILCQRYDDNGGTLHITTPARMGKISLAKTAPLTSLQLTERPDLCPPVCALVGGAHAIYPASGDVREPGAFIYAVPVQADADGNQRAGSSPASQKSVIKGVPIPERRAYRAHAAEYQLSPLTANSDALKFFKTCFPNYSPFLQYAQYGSAFIFVTQKADLVKDETSADSETQQPPSNYSEEPENWGSGQQDGVYVMTDGSFTASANSRKNLRGLKWCKAKITTILAIPRAGIPSELHPLANDLFPGMLREDGEKFAFAQLTLDCVLINRKKRVFDPATNQPCSTDAEYNAESDDSLTLADYRLAMEAYYNATRDVQTEGNIAMLDDGTIQPDKLTGCTLTVQGKRPQWETMQAVIRGVSWNVARGVLSISVGTRAQIGFDEYLERRRLNRNNARDAAQHIATPFDVADTEQQTEQENALTVSPSISPGLVPAARGKFRRPGTLYAVKDENDKTTYWLAGGTIRKGGKRFVVEDTPEQITAGEKNGQSWTYGKPVKVQVVYDAQRNPTTFNITQ